MLSCICTCVRGKWEALGAEIGRPVDDDFKLIALRELVPREVGDLMATQVSLKSFPAALAYVRRHVTEQVYATQVAQVQKQAKSTSVPMDVGSLSQQVISLLAGQQGVGHVSSPHGPGTPTGELEVSGPDACSNGEDSVLNQVLEALKGKGKGRGKGASQQDNWVEKRSCWICGQRGHLGKNCPQRKSDAPDPKGGKGGKGKGKSVHELAVDTCPQSGHGHDEAICCSLMKTSPATSLRAVSISGETWGGYRKVEATLDSGAADCVCGLEDFPEEMLAEPNEQMADVQYICADGGKIPNLGTKTVQGLTTQGEKMSVKFQVTQVTRPLIAVSKLTEAGHDVNLHKKGGTIRNHASGKVTTVRKVDGVYVLDIWVRCTPASLSGGSRQ